MLQWALLLLVPSQGPCPTHRCFCKRLKHQWLCCSFMMHYSIGVVVGWEEQECLLLNACPSLLPLCQSQPCLPKGLVTWNNAGKDWEGGGGEMEQEWCFPCKQKRWVRCLKQGFLHVLSQGYRTVSRNDSDNCTICQWNKLKCAEQRSHILLKVYPSNAISIFKI